MNINMHDRGGPQSVERGWCIESEHGVIAEIAFCHWWKHLIKSTTTHARGCVDCVALDFRVNRVTGHCEAYVVVSHWEEIVSVCALRTHTHDCKIWRRQPPFVIMEQWRAQIAIGI